jgi:septal ring factor EnvC (AmiA/AmiB activator)
MERIPESRRLLTSVVRRLELVSLGRVAFVASLICCGVYFSAFAASRLLGVVPDWFHPTSVAVVPLAGLLGGVLFRRRVGLQDAARRVDSHGQTHDLFLTVTTLTPNSGEYQSLVISAAEERAATIAPQLVVPFVWLPRLSWAAGTVAVLLLAVLFLPQFDPFGRVEAVASVERAAEELTESREHTRLRVESLKAEAKEEGELSDEVEAALDEVAERLSEMKRDQQEKNAELIAGLQEEVGAMWRAARSSDELKELLNRESLDQGFGRDIETLRKWAEELSKGETASLDKQADDIVEMLQKLRKTQDPVEQQEIEQDLRRAMQELEDFAENQVKSPQLEAALKRTMSQLAQSRQNGQLSDEALEAAVESVRLAKMELREIAKSAEEFQKLEQALEAMQLAKKLNRDGELEGQPGEGASIADYVELYQQIMLAQGGGAGNVPGGQGAGEGQDTGGKGSGEGGKVAENDSTKTDFESRTSKSAVEAGKVLLSIKTRGAGEQGDEKLEYRELIREVRKGMTEAIEVEEIPPGYVPGIKKYFDALDAPQPAK